MLLLGFDAHPSPDRGLFPLIPAHGLGGRETSNFLPLHFLSHSRLILVPARFDPKKEKPPAKPAGLHSRVLEVTR